MPAQGIMERQRPGSASTLPAWPTLEWRIDVEDRTPLSLLTQKQLARLLASFETADGCWTWTAGHWANGYGRFYVGRRPVKAHRLVYELLIGPIPKELVPDHLCRNLTCVRPSHIELVTTRENILRGSGPSAVNARREHCVSGHPLAGDNLLIYPNGSRHCRECDRFRSKMYARRRRASLRTNPGVNL